MSRASAVGLISAALVAIASAAPEPASAQDLDTRSILTTPSAAWLSPPLQHRPAFASCGSPPGFGYGPFWSPWDARFSRYWFSPAYRWYGSWAEWPGLGYGSYWPAAGWGAWSPWPVSRGMCRSPGSFYRGFGFGFGFGIGISLGSGYGPGYWGYGGYGDRYWGYGGYGDRYSGYGGYGTHPDSWRTGGALGLDTGAGHVPESVRLMNGYRVIESRPTTGGADLQRIDRARLDRSRADLESARTSLPEDARTLTGRTAVAGGREVRQPSRPSTSPRPTPGARSSPTPSAKSSPTPSARSRPAPTARPSTGTASGRSPAASTRRVAPATRPARSPSKAARKTKPQ